MCSVDRGSVASAVFFAKLRNHHFPSESLRSWGWVSSKNVLLPPVLPPYFHHLDTCSDLLTLTPVVLTAGRQTDWVIRLGCAHSPVWWSSQSGTSCRWASRVTPSLCSHSATGLLHQLQGDYLEEGIPFEKWGGVGPSASDTVMFTHQGSGNVTAVPLRYDTSQILCFIITTWDLLCLTAAFRDI